MTDFYDVEDMLGDHTVLQDPIHELSEYVSDKTLTKFYRSALEKMKLDLSGYVKALRKLPSNAERRAMLAGYAKEIQPALREILTSEGLL